MTMDTSEMNEAAKAADLKVRFEEAIKPALAIYSEAASYGMAIAWQNWAVEVTLIGPAPTFKAVIVGINITKKLA